MALSVSLSGLSEIEAQTRLQSEGYNELPRQDRRTPLRIVLEVFREPMFALLLGGGLVYLLLGDLKEALILLVFAVLSVAITVVQETRTERVLEALRVLALTGVFGTACKRQPTERTMVTTNAISTTAKHTNRLAREKSPYLLQHQHNPVDWYAWGEEAFAKARGGEQADFPEHRLFDLPLVPRDGARIV